MKTLAVIMALTVSVYAEEPYFSSDGDTVYYGSTASIGALDIPALGSGGARLGNGGPGFTTRTIWNPELRLTYISDSLGISSNPHATVCGDTIFVSFGLNMPWATAPFLISSMDGGGSWSDIWCITNEDTAQSASSVYINYFDHTLNVGGKAAFTDEFNYYNMYSKYSNDLGISWSEPHFLFNQGQQYIGKYGGASNLDTLFFGFFHERDYHSIPIDTLKTAYSCDNGENWSDLRGGIRLYNNFDNYWLSLRYSMGRVHLLYQDSSSIENLTEIFYAYSEDWGESWKSPAVVSDDSSQHSQWPYLYASPDGMLIASWYDYKYGYGGGGFTGDILYRISTDNGESWGEEMQLTDHHEATASRSFVNGNHIGILWEDHRTGFFVPEFYYAESFDLGQTWSEEIRLTDAQGETMSPDLHFENGELLLFWEDARDNPPFQEEIYFRKAEITETSTNDGEPRIPQTFSLISHPNPFNSRTILTLKGMEGGDAEIRIFDVTGAFVKTLSTREGKASWDATDNSGQKVSSGIYFARVETPQGATAIKILYLK